jgi:hypothetical protein
MGDGHEPARGQEQSASQAGKRNPSLVLAPGRRRSVPNAGRARACGGVAAT